jgi:hypothetical protein
MAFLFQVKHACLQNRRNSMHCHSYIRNSFFLCCLTGLAASFMPVIHSHVVRCI